VSYGDIAKNGVKGSEGTSKKTDRLVNTIGKTTPSELKNIQQFSREQISNDVHKGSSRFSHDEYENWKEKKSNSQEQSASKNGDNQKSSPRKNNQSSTYGSNSRNFGYKSNPVNSANKENQVKGSGRFSHDEYESWKEKKSNPQEQSGSKCWDNQKSNPRKNTQRASYVNNSRNLGHKSNPVNSSNKENQPKNSSLSSSSYLNYEQTYAKTNQKSKSSLNTGDKK
jgi:hypothetical protein